MRYLSFVFFLVLINSVYAHEHQMVPEGSGASNITLALENAPDKIVANQAVTVRFRLLKEHKPISLDNMNEVHTARIHLLVIDPSLTDYHHIHPSIDKQNQDLVFSFIPKKDGVYRVWADITPASTNQQEFLMADIGAPLNESSIDKTVRLNSVISPYHFALKLDGEPKAGQQVMATIRVSQGDKPFNQLEPVMGAFAHVVGFNEDYSSILHIHPMGKEPGDASARGGPMLMFHIAPKKAGFVKLFAQFRIDGKDVYVPFGIRVN